MVNDIMLTEASKKDYKRIKKLYFSAFPAEERFPFFLMRRRALSGKAEMLNITENDEWIGFVYMICDDSLAYIFFFAIDEKYRGRGYGTAAIKDVIARYKGRRVFLALEDWNEQSPNREQRVKRHDFYRNCGLFDLDHRIKELSVVFSAMSAGGAIEPHEYDALTDKWLGGLLKRIIDMRMIDGRKQEES